MLDKILNWFKGIRKKDIQTLSVQNFNLNNDVTYKEKTTNTVFLNDPTNPQLIIEQPDVIPVLPIRSVGESGCGFSLGSIQQQALASKQIVADVLRYMCKKNPNTINHWAATNSLTIMSRAGQDVNAFYDRSSLRFFYFSDPKKNKIIYACDSRSVVAHEFGHAFLDILRPDLWNTQASEVWAFHEFFGDATAILAMLNYDELIDHAISETNGNLLQSNILTRLAAEMGEGLYHLTNGQGGMLPNCLRDISIKHQYKTPESLPNNGPDNVIINESHSFSRILSNAFYESIIRIAQKHTEMPLKDALKHARDVMAEYLISASKSAPHCVRFFDAFCRQILHIDKSNGSKYQSILVGIFSDRNIIQSKLLILADADIDAITKQLDTPFEIQTYGDAKIVRTLGAKTIKLVDNLGLTALSDNPLLNLEIDVPNETAYYFNENNKLIDISESHKDEIVDAALTCLQILNTKNLVGSHDSALFQDNFGKLVRKQIVCTCGRSNACIPGQPEYNKPWKPSNNSGCVKCFNQNCKPKSCDCKSPPIPQPPKTGCYTSVKTGGITVYRSGNGLSRKVC